MNHVRQEKMTARPGAPGKTLQVKIMGAAGTILSPTKLISHALEYEAAVDGDDDENIKYYPLSLLKGSQGQWRQVGLDAKSRWKHLRGAEFRQLFGMDKEAFDQLPEWKQKP